MGSWIWLTILFVCGIVYIMIKCPRCGSSMKRRAGYAFRGGKKYQRWQCLECGTTKVEGATRPEWLVKEKREKYA